MRTWVRRDVPCYCGNCGETVNAGEPLLEITSEKIRRPLHRCASCEGPAPPDLPPIVVKHQTTTRMTALAKAKPEWMPYKE